jgi:hypothetical protein
MKDFESIPAPVVSIPRFSGPPVETTPCPKCGSGAFAQTKPFTDENIYWCGSCWHEWPQELQEGAP